MMSQLAPFADLILEALQEYHRRNAIAGWYSAENLADRIKKKHPDAWKQLSASFSDSPKVKVAVRDAIDAYLPSLNQRVLQRYPTNIIWRISAATKPPEAAPKPKEKPKPTRPRRQRGQPWISLIDKKNVKGLKRWLEEGGDPNAPGRDPTEGPLNYAAVWGDESIIRLLLEHGATGSQAVAEAVSNDRGDIARLLLQESNPNLDDLRQAGALLRAVVNDPELERLIQKFIRKHRKEAKA